MKTELKNKFALEYFKSVEKELLCSGEQKVMILNQLEDSLLEYSEKNPEAMAVDYESRFGNPIGTAEDIVLSFNEGDLKKKVEKSKLIKKLVLLIFFIILAVVIITGLTIIIWNVVTSPETIEEDMASLLISTIERNIML